MGAKSILTKQYMAPIFLHKFDDSCIKFHNRASDLSYHRGEDRESKKQLQKRALIAAEIEDHIQNGNVLELKWISSTTGRLILSTGIVILIFVDDDYEGRELSFAVHRFPLIEEICQVAWEKDTGVLLTSDGKLHMFKWNVLQSPEIFHIEAFQNFLSVLNPKRVERRMLLSETATEFAIWWSGGGSDVFPWNPKPEQRANVLVYSISPDMERPNLIFYKKTDGNLLSVQFLPDGNEVITIEDFNGIDTSVIAELKLIKYSLESQLRISEVVIPLQSQLKCHAVDRLKEKICLGLCNASIIISFQDGKITRSTKAAFVPCNLTWHKNSLVVLAIGPIGQVQMFDIALNPLFFKDQTERHIPTLMTQLEPLVSVYQASWGHFVQSTKAFVLLGFDSGNISVLHLYTGPMRLTDLVSRHLEAFPPAYAEAIKLLGAVPWESDLCRTTFHIIFSRLRVEEYSDTIEQYFEDLLETYFNPRIQPLEAVWLEHRERMNIRAMSYHHWLFLAGKYKRSLEIAVMIGDEGCVRKVYLTAVRTGATDVSSEAESVLKNMRNTMEAPRSLAKSGQPSSTDSSDRSNENSWCSTCSSSESVEESEQIFSRLEISSEEVEQSRLEKEAILQSCDGKHESFNGTGESSSGITVVRLGDV